MHDYVKQHNLYNEYNDLVCKLKDNLSEERFLHNASEASEDIDRAMDLLKDARRIFNGRGLIARDKKSLFNCLSEIYFDAITNDSNNN